MHAINNEQTFGKLNNDNKNAIKNIKEPKPTSE